MCIYKGMIRIVSSRFQTKNWRKDNICNKNGQKDGSSEKYQRRLVQEITNRVCEKRNGWRINHRTLVLRKNTRPMKHEDGYDWSEDFDGFQNIGEVEVYYNFKFVCDSGGAQTRTLRDETYKFIETQLKFLNTDNSRRVLFVNILDGDTSYNARDKFKYLLGLEEYKECTVRCFVGDMEKFQSWFSKLFSR